jgi:hypothetical protein
MHITRTVASLAITVAAIAGITAPITSADEVTRTVDGVDYPVCSMEDCSDQAGQVGIWYSKSMDHWLLISGEHTQVITN